MSPARALVAALVALSSLAATSGARAQPGTSGPYAHVMDPLPGGTSFGLGAFSAYEPVVAPFVPEDPATGVPLILAYLPSPLLFLDRPFEGDPVRRDIVLVQLVAGLLGAVVSAWALVDALQREASSDIAFASLATAHALGWNLQMAVSSSVRLGLSQYDGPRIDAAVPVVIAFPLRGGAGIAPRWTF
jgi:hypothetical protein